MVVTQSSSCHPSSTRSSMLSLNISEFFGRGGGLDVITSYHHFRIKELFPDNVIFLLNSFSREGSSVAASSVISVFAVSASLKDSVEIFLP